MMLSYVNILIEVKKSIMEFLLYQNNYVDCILVSYKTTNNERTEQGYCPFISDNLCVNIYHYITANKVL